jgi:hypothetical protein
VKVFIASVSLPCVSTAVYDSPSAAGYQHLLTAEGVRIDEGRA